MKKNDHILARGCRTHNLGDFTVELPKQKLTVVTGVSGSGKSSFAFDTLLAEGQRRYMESLSSRFRSQLSQLPRPDVDYIEGLSPTLSVEQHTARLNKRTTVGTHTDTYDLLALLFARAGTQHSPTTNKPLSRLSETEIVEAILRDYPDGSAIQLLAHSTHSTTQLEKMGYIRLRELDEKVEVTIDRIRLKAGIRERLADSVHLALELGRGILTILGDTTRTYSEVYLCAETGETFPPLTPATFNFNSIYGACPACKGSGIGGTGLNCATCHGARLGRQGLHVRLQGHTLPELCALPIDQLHPLLYSWSFNGSNQRIADELLPRIDQRLTCLLNIGLPYLTLDRSGDTLSVGEAQRVQLASQIGADLSGVVYILDEPSRGLHPQDTAKLGEILLSLRDAGNTLLLVEHDPTLIALADHIIELGPGAGIHGGQLLYSGPYSDWPSPLKPLPRVKPRSKASKTYPVKGATLHNLHNLSLDIPLQRLVGFCGVSGAGKSTLLLDHLAPILKEEPTRLLVIDQAAAGVSRTSIPATYVGIMTHLRTLLASTPLARARGWRPDHFSLTKKGGRCETCQGLGTMRVQMEFLPTISTPCDTCLGKRYNYEALQVTWKGYSLADILALTVAEAQPLFANLPELHRRLTLMAELGLDYLKLGQSFTTLSGGEAQRLKLVTELAKKTYEPTLYILDEPSAGLHQADIIKLAAILQRLVDAGHTVWLIDHNLDLLNQCDHLIELSPHENRLLFSGTPAALSRKATPTGQAFHQS